MKSQNVSYLSKRRQMIYDIQKTIVFCLFLCQNVHMCGHYWHISISMYSDSSTYVSGRHFSIYHCSKLHRIMTDLLVVFNNESTKTQYDIDRNNLSFSFCVCFLQKKHLEQYLTCLLAHRHAFLHIYPLFNFQFDFSKAFHHFRHLNYASFSVFIQQYAYLNEVTYCPLCG